MEGKATNLNFALILLAFAFTACAHENERAIALQQNHLLENIAAPGTPDALKILLRAIVHDDGRQEFQIAMKLNNENASTGEKWSDLLTSDFQVRLGAQKFRMHLHDEYKQFLMVPVLPPEESPRPEDSPLYQTTFANLHNQRIDLLKLNDEYYSLDFATTPRALSVLTENFPALWEGRLQVSRCRLLSGDPEPGLYWRDTNSEQLSLFFGLNETDEELSLFKIKVVDNTYWRPIPALFTPFMTAEEIRQANIPDGNGGYGAVIKDVSMRLKRVSTSSTFRIGNSSRRLPVNIYVQQDFDHWPIAYVGGCP